MSKGGRFGRARLQGLQSSRSPSSPPVRSPPTPTCRGSSTTPPAALSLPFTGRKSHSVPSQYGGRPAIRNPRESCREPWSPAWRHLLRKHVIAVAGDHICWLAGVVYQSRETAAEPLDRDLEAPRLPFPDRPGQSFEGQFFVVPPSIFWSTTVASGRPAKRKLLTSRGPLRTWNPPE